MSNMDKFKNLEMNTEELHSVVGGEDRIVYDKSGSSNVVSAPGVFDAVMYKVHNGDSVSMTGRSVVNGDYTWYELEDGGWIRGSQLQ